MPQLLDGIRIRDEILKECAPRVEALKAERSLPGLAVILAGHNPASEIYVRNKVKACQQLGIYSEKITPPDTITTDELLALVDKLNHRDEIDGILVQMPLPPQIVSLSDLQMKVNGEPTESVSLAGDKLVWQGTLTGEQPANVAVPWFTTAPPPTPAELPLNTSRR